MKKKTLAEIILITALVIISLCMQYARIDYGKSDIYSKSDMKAAIKLIKSEFRGWTGCRLLSLAYVGDECNDEHNIEWMNESNPNEPYTQCIEFQSDFRTPFFGKNADVLGPNEKITNWQWWLARTDGGEWKLITWGY